MLPAAGLIALADQPAAGARPFLRRSWAVAVLLVALAWAPFWFGPATLGIDRRGLFTTSLPAFIFALLTGRAAEQTLRLSSAWWRRPRPWPSRSGEGCAPWVTARGSACRVALSHLDVLSVGHLHLVPALVHGLAGWTGGAWRERGASRAAVVFGFLALAKPLIFVPLYLWRLPFPSVAWRELRLSPSVMAAPWLSAAVTFWAREACAGRETAWGPRATGCGSGKSDEF